MVAATWWWFGRRRLSPVWSRSAGSPTSCASTTERRSSAVQAERRAELIAERFGLGDDPVITGPVARGEVGEVWRLTTSEGSWAVKAPFAPPSFAEAEDDAQFQDVVRSAGVPMPALIRASDGASIV